MTNSESSYRIEISGGGDSKLVEEHTEDLVRLLLEKGIRVSQATVSGARFSFMNDIPPKEK